MYERLAPLQHDSLDDVPEPSETMTLVGHHEVRALLDAAIGGNKLHHAILLTGQQGIGKATLAFHLAARLLGESSRAGDWCRAGGSPLFRQIASGAHPGVLHLTRPFDEKAKKFKTVITADEIRRVSRFLSLRTHDDGYRIVIIDPADDMNRSAANALLKSLEEPPAKVLFLLISHSPGRLLPTIRSRAQTIKLHSLSDTEVFEVLDAFGASGAQDQVARSEIARRAKGSPRAALMLTLHGGLEIAEATEKVVAGNPHDIAGIYRLADAVSGRDSGMQFAIFNTYVLDRLSERAAELAQQGMGEAAAKVADAWDSANRQIGELEAYNLDKKGHVLAMVRALRNHQAR
ncbi:MAG TPA: DNA polymerase III subunit delta' [Tianweitania sediminis]|jgi:DNA polymerase-3 subunit delta'|nr:DNA polymerase III subunit delta' [Tianweitania sediminis]